MANTRQHVHNQFGESGPNKYLNIQQTNPEHHLLVIFDNEHDICIYVFAFDMEALCSC